MSRGRSARAALLPLLLLAACGGPVGIAEEEELGDAYAAQIGQELPLVRDAAAVAALNEIGDELARHADLSGRDYDFYLVDSPDVNAFAIPGGHIFVNRGLVERADELSELAGVLGHEIAHVTERHGLEQVEDQQRANLLLSLLYMILGREPGLLEQIAIQGGGAAVFAKYGRDAEREADERAVETLVSAGYHPEGMATFFEELLRDQERNPNLFEQWFSTHPTSEERVESARAVIRQLEATPGVELEPLTRDSPEYQRFRARVSSSY